MLSASLNKTFLSLSCYIKHLPTPRPLFVILQVFINFVKQQMEIVQEEESERDHPPSGSGSNPRRGGNSSCASSSSSRLSNSLSEDSLYTSDSDDECILRLDQANGVNISLFVSDILICLSVCLSVCLYTSDSDDKCILRLDQANGVNISHCVSFPVHLSTLSISSYLSPYSRCPISPYFFIFLHVSHFLSISSLPFHLFISFCLI